MLPILLELQRQFQHKQAALLCRVIETRGSTPQKPGAAMLVLPDGAQLGTLGGGCVEAEVKQRALALLAEGGIDSTIATFHLDDNYGWDDGLICGGRMTMLIAPMRPEAALHAIYLEKQRVCLEAGLGCTEAVAYDPDNRARRYLFDATGKLLAQDSEGPPPPIVTEHLLPLQTRPRPYHRLGIAYLPHLPRITLLIVGGGHVGQAVAKLAAEADFAIWVLDDRASYASQERFPGAERRLVGDIGHTLRDLTAQGIGSDVYCLVITRGHGHDEEALYHLAGCGAGYVGMIGSKRKIKLIFEDLLAKGISGEALARVQAPLGLNIGSQTVPEIAISIVAELIAFRNLGTTSLTPRTSLLPSVR